MVEGRHALRQDSQCRRQGHTEPYGSPSAEAVSNMTFDLFVMQRTGPEAPISDLRHASLNISPATHVRFVLTHNSMKEAYRGT